MNHRANPLRFAIASALLGSVLCLVGCAAGSNASPAAPQYRVIGTLSLPGDTGWDFLAVDGRRHHLLLTRGNAVQIVDLASGKLVGTVEGLHGVHGIAIVGDTGYVTNGQSNSVSIIDLNAMRQVGEITGTGDGPDAIVYYSTDRRLYTMNHRGGNITAIDASSGTVVAAIRAIRELESVAVDGTGRLFVNGEEAAEIAVVDLHAARMVTRWKLQGCDGPTGLALDQEHQRLFTTCDNRVMLVVDTSSGAVVASVPIGDRPDAAAFDPGLQMIYSSNGEGTLTVVHEDDPNHFHVVTTVATRRGARTVAIDPESHRLYLPTADFAPAPESANGAPAPRPKMIPGTFQVIVVAPQ